MKSKITIFLLLLIIAGLFIFSGCKQKIGPNKTGQKELKEPLSGQVIIQLDKTNYSQNESVKAIIINGLAAEMHKSSVDNSWLVLKMVNDNWEIIMNGKQKRSALCLCQEYPNANCPAFTPLLEKFDAVKSGEKLAWIWDQTILQKSKTGCFNWQSAGPGTYKIQFRYFSGADQKNWQIVDSGEFSIK
jgi:hypothetical protein